MPRPNLSSERPPRARSHPRAQLQRSRLPPDNHGGAGRALRRARERALSPCGPTSARCSWQRWTTYTRPPRRPGRSSLPPPTTRPVRPSSCSSTSRRTRASTGSIASCSRVCRRTDDPEIAQALKQLYERFHRFVHGQVKVHREEVEEEDLPDVALVAWAIMGLGTLSNIGRELGLLSARSRKRLVGGVGRALLGER